jgi:cell division septation protein DedD
MRLMLSTTALVGLLAGCETFQGLNFPNLRPNAEGAAAPAAAGGKTVERDVEAPEVFSATDQGLWDGRPSLGGVWVAHPDVTEPERVIIRNDQNGKFVIGALFRRERDLPGPKLQISSDAAAALNILAGAPAPLNVTALRREEAQEAPATETGEALDIGAETAAGVAAPAEVTETTLDPIAAAGAAIEAAPATPAPTAAPAPAPAPKPAAPVSNLAKPFVQIGIFSVKANADRTAKQMRGAGLTALIKQGETSGKPFWRVVVGPAANRAQLSNLLKKVKAEGFSDAYAVTN